VVLAVRRSGATIVRAVVIVRSVMIVWPVMIAWAAVTSGSAMRVVMLSMLILHVPHDPSNLPFDMTWKTRLGSRAEGDAESFGLASATKVHCERLSGGFRTNGVAHVFGIADRHSIQAQDDIANEKARFLGGSLGANDETARSHFRFDSMQSETQKGGFQVALICQLPDQFRESGSGSDRGDIGQEVKTKEFTLIVHQRAAQELRQWSETVDQGLSGEKSDLSQRIPLAVSGDGHHDPWRDLACPGDWSIGLQGFLELQHGEVHGGDAPSDPTQDRRAIGEADLNFGLSVKGPTGGQNSVFRPENSTRVGTTATVDPNDPVGRLLREFGEFLGECF